MTSRTVRILFLAAGIALAATNAEAQGTMGSVTVQGNADSLYAAMLAYVRQKSYVVEAQDSVRRTVRFLVPDAKGEAVTAIFTARRDSTLIEAQGVRGGMVALIMGLGTVREMLAQRDSTRPRAP